MKTHVLSSYKNFLDGCDRAAGLKSIFDYLRKTAPAAMDCDDILRSALVLALSSFDLFIHDLFRLEVAHRLGTKREITSLRIPFNALIGTKQTQMDMIDACIRRDNSYKSFVAPDKLAECLRILVDEPWDRIANSLGDLTIALKGKLRSVVDLRNRIVHEADVNPTFGGVALWPIYSEDVDASIVFLRKLGASIAQIVNDV